MMLFDISGRRLAGLAFSAMVVGLAIASPASARRVVIDGVTMNPMTTLTSPALCVYGSTCAGDTLGFSVNAGSGLTNQIFVYDNGLVSLGAEITAPAGPVTSLADFGPNVFSAAFTPGVTANSFSLGKGVANAFFSGDNVYRVEYTAPGDAGPTHVQFSIYSLTDGAPGDFALWFGHGDDFGGAPPTLDANTIIGYNFGLGALETTAGPDDVAVQGEDSFEYVFRNEVTTDPTSPAPEPISWALMVSGFGLAGAALRRRVRHDRRALAAG